MFHVGMVPPSASCKGNIIILVPTLHVEQDCTVTNGKAPRFLTTAIEKGSPDTLQDNWRQHGNQQLAPC